MGAILRFRASTRKTMPKAVAALGSPCEIVIFPGVRIERHDLDLGHRLRDSIGRGDFNDIGGGHLPRKTS